MKKSLLLGIGLAVSTAASYGQGYVFLDNYGSLNQNNLITYGPTGGGPLNAGISNSFTVGVYFGQGTFSAAADTTLWGNDIPTSLNALLLLATGSGTTAQASSTVFDTDGRFSAPATMQAHTTAGQSSTFMVVAYNGADYASSLIRGHSAAFTMATASGSTVPPIYLGDGMGPFQVNVTIPEPSTLALAGLGLASMLIARRRK